jgi:CPA2 family monovalent cation:H+ antiporter-2
VHTTEFLRSLTIVLTVAAITTVLFHRLRQPVVLGYILAGVIVGPHTSIPLVADPQVVETLSELGVILLMFSLGLEFSLSRLARVGPTAGATALMESTLMMWLGFLTGRLMGWTVLESVFTGAVIAISSTTIVAKVFEEQHIGGRLRQLVFGILLTEDLIVVVLLATLTALATGARISAAALAPTLGRLAVFLLALLTAGLLVVPRFIRFVVRQQRAETTLVASVGICFAMAFIAREAGYSVALGAFLAGSLVSESAHGEEIEQLIRPLRDMFLAIFFVSVGLLIDPALVLRHWNVVLVLTGVVIVGKVLSVTFGAFVTGSGTRTAVQAGMSLAQIGEFSFIIAGLGASLGATRDFLYPVAVTVSALTTLTTPWLVRGAGPAAALIDRKLPHRLQTFSALYAAWLERLRAAGPARDLGVRRMVRLLVLDSALFAALIVATAAGLESATERVAPVLRLGPEASTTLVLALAAAISIPLVLGIGRLSHRLGSALAVGALPKGVGKVDFDAAPRGALVVMLQLGIAVLTATVIVAVTQPFLPSYPGLVVLALMVAGFGIAIWRSAKNLEGHVQAGSQAVVERLTKYARAGTSITDSQPMIEIQSLFFGLGEPEAVRLGAESPAVGRSLAELNLRGRTGATVLAISRGGEPILAPVATERLASGDVVALAGSREAIDAARAALLPKAENRGDQ